MNLYGLPAGGGPRSAPGLDARSGTHTPGETTSIGWAGSSRRATDRQPAASAFTDTRPTSRSDRLPMNMAPGMTHVPSFAVTPDLSSLRPDERTSAYQYNMFMAPLTFNSKDLITALTKVAGENLQNYNPICHAIEQRILLAPAEMKLPALYLLDSIAKNIGGVYVHRFQGCIFRCFVCTFEAGSATVRASLHRLLNTWPAIFGVQITDSIRRHVSTVPALRSSATTTAPYSQAQAAGRVTAGHLVGVPYSRADTRMVHPTVSASIGQPRNASSSAAGLSPTVLQVESIVAEMTRKSAAGITPSQLELSSVLSLINRENQNMSLSPNDRNKLYALQCSAQSLVAQTSALPRHAPPVSATPVSHGLAAMGAGVVERFPRSAPHRAVGASGSQPISMPRSANAPVPGPARATVADFERLKSFSHSDIVRALYAELSFLSRADGMRFKEQSELRRHLDWLFLQNKRKRARRQNTGATRASRCWFESDRTTEGKTPDAIFGKAAGDTPVEAPERQSVVSQVAECTAEGASEQCPVCFEEFASRWDDDRQSWILSDAVRAADGHAYHPGCLPPDESGQLVTPNDEPVPTAQPMLRSAPAPTTALSAQKQDVRREPLEGSTQVVVSLPKIESALASANMPGTLRDGVESTVHTDSGGDSSTHSKADTAALGTTDPTVASYGQTVEGVTGHHVGQVHPKQASEAAHCLETTPNSCEGGAQTDGAPAVPHPTTASEVSADVAVAKLSAMVHPVDNIAGEQDALAPSAPEESKAPEGGAENNKRDISEIMPTAEPAPKRVRTSM